jgi:hypothetical protein
MQTSDLHLQQVYLRYPHELLHTSKLSRTSIPRKSQKTAKLHLRSKTTSKRLEGNPSCPLSTSTFHFFLAITKLLREKPATSATAADSDKLELKPSSLLRSQDKTVASEENT